MTERKKSKGCEIAVADALEKGLICRSMAARLRPKEWQVKSTLVSHQGMSVKIRERIVVETVGRMRKLGERRRGERGKRESGERKEKENREA
jgi:hypothetical protein